MFVSRSFDLIEGHWECEKHAIRLGCLICKALLREGGCKFEKLEIRAVIKYFCKKGMSPKETHEDFMETPGKESPYSTVKNGQHSSRGGERALRMINGLAAQKMISLMKMSRSCIPWLCVIGGETCEA